MSEPGLNCEFNASFKQIFTLKLFIAFEMVYSCCFSFGGNLDFPEFLQKQFYNINYRSRGDRYKVGNPKKLALPFKRSQE